MLTSLRSRPLRPVPRALGAQNYCAEIKLRAERKAGDMLAENVKHTGGRPKQRSRDVTVLRNVGVSKMESHRWQRIASVPTL